MFGNGIFSAPRRLCARLVVNELDVTLYNAHAACEHRPTWDHFAWIEWRRHKKCAVNANITTEAWQLVVVESSCS